MIQEALFNVPVPDAPIIPPSGTNPPMLAEPLGPCARSGCQEPATLKSPSGNPQSIYCEQHGYCGHYYIDRQARCVGSIEDFVLHPRLNIWVCPCMGMD
jgi:hypothetical protein